MIMVNLNAKPNVELNLKTNIEISKILYLKSHINYTEFMLLNQESLIFSYTLQRYEHILQSHNFKRVHRSYLVNMAHVVLTERDKLVLTEGIVIPMSRRKRIPTKN
jgi:DNA-binding LytR/AlgR family response regulator